MVGGHFVEQNLAERRAVIEARIQDQTRTDIIGTIKNTDLQLTFFIESNTDTADVWQIRIETNGRSDQVLRDFAERLTPGKTVKIAKGLEREEGQLSVNPEDISVED